MLHIMFLNFRMEANLNKLWTCNQNLQTLMHYADLCGNMVFPLKNDGQYTAVVDKKVDAEEKHALLDY